MGLTLDDVFVRVSRNYAQLRRAVDAAGRALAKQPYETFVALGADLSFSETVNGAAVLFVADIYRIDTDGTLYVSVELETELSTPFRIKPGMVFKKLKDESAYVLKSHYSPR